MESIVITGAGTGLGKELALQYAQNGYSIILTGRRIQPLIEVKQEIESLGGEAFAYPLDIRCYEEVYRTVNSIIQDHHVTCLVNNAGIGYFGPFSSLTHEQINEMIQTNVNGTIYMTKAFLPYFQTLPKAKVINIISTAGLRGKINESVYVATKFAIRGFSESLVKELEQTNISVTAVYMGGMDTPFWQGTDHIKDRSRLRSAQEVAKQIIALENGQPEIILS
ncbi:SDR family NAD(P)-dependent oxidoreductase [Thermaerobacillus caldiproteolyticus]|uniref:SDR family NAD(P)-dependent oxidoreductase n=1 Tax=Thermaerobacillus caldiproteolyticus TaxID=247480 RepID=UPI00188C145F|nr:SDR family NAD(P)-dependent oxidoreductase [Anoxybacillus caldiproteolyticus]QPA31373.1 SDR family NAD(P)-dependent oxidoreductase [Anoxybacillus caldiproteolyticus]